MSRRTDSRRIQSGDAQSPVRLHLATIDEAASAPLELGRRGQALLARAGERLAELGTMSWLAVGSASCGTSVRPFSDVDMLAVFEDPVRHALLDRSSGEARLDTLLSLADVAQAPPLHQDPDAAYRTFADCLEADGTIEGFGQPQRSFPAVRYESLTNEPSVELVPGSEGDFLWDAGAATPTSGLAFLVFPGEGGRWLGTHPGLHRTLLDSSPGGVDYGCRELIRLLKLVNYWASLGITSYFLELFALRWIEGSHDLPAATIAEVVEAMERAGRQPYAGTSELSADVGNVLGALLSEARSVALGGSPLCMADLGTPETVGRTSAFGEAGANARRLGRLANVVQDLRRARWDEEHGHLECALGTWRNLLRHTGQPYLANDDG